eukprot:NODE_318_length_9930_cov_0.612857.p3 type:complete len:103 gc:universal NODE_318_length_9930_cov_0.612857:2389-2697(+)
MGILVESDFHISHLISLVPKVRADNLLTVYYSAFITNYSHLASPLTRATRKDYVPFQWTKELDTAFKILKSSIAKELVLVQPQVDIDLELLSMLVGLLLVLF